MAITQSKQLWEVGNVVKVGFLKLRITGFVPTPGDGHPDVYFLESLDGSKSYEFTPHHGLRFRAVIVY